MKKSRTFAALALASALAPVRAGAAALTVATSPLLLPGATQYQAYSAPAQTASGGVRPYTWSVTANDATLPEGMTMNPADGSIASQSVGGEGGYQFQVQVQDSSGATATALETIEVNADSSLGGCSVFPANSIFHQRVDSLPVDASPAAPIPSSYQSASLRANFGAAPLPGPNGIPFIRVPYDQPLVNMTFSYTPESDPSPYPFPTDAPVEGTADAGATADRHVLVLQTAGGGQPCRLWEVFQGSYNGNNTWDATNGAYWDLGSNNLRPFGWTSADAAGLPMMPLTLNYDELMSGTLNHPIRFTLTNTLNYDVWPARHTAGTGTCTAAGGGTIPVRSVLSQSSPPASCTFSGPMGEIYRLKASVDTSACSSHPQASKVLAALKAYGMILADNGTSGFLIGTPDARWIDSDLSCIANFTLSQFEPVNVGSLQINPDSGATSAAGSTLLAVSVSVPTAGAVLSYDAVLSGTVSDNVGVSSVAVSVDGRPYLPAVGTSSWNYALPLLTVGAHTVSVQAWDASGNSAVSRQVDFSVNDAPPVVLHAALVYPNPVVEPYDPVIRICPGPVDSISVTIYDLLGRAVNRSTQFSGPSTNLPGEGNGQYCYEYTWTGRIASGIYIAVVHASGSGGSVDAKLRFAVVR